jgi:hypothetical protein
MLDLDARVHLHEVEAAVGVEQELHRARAEVADRLRAAHRESADRAALLLRQERARRLLDQLLVIALHRALALAEMDQVAVHVAEQLELDVTRARDVLLEIQRVVRERGLGLGLRDAEARAQRLLVPRDAHPAPAAARRPP